MNLSKLFKMAHKLAKKVIKAGDNYRVTFGACVKAVKEAYFGKTTATINEWTKKGTRFYINFEVPCTRFGGMTDAKAGYIEVINKEADFSNVAEEYRDAIKNVLEIRALIAGMKKAHHAISQTITF